MYLDKWFIILMVIVFTSCTNQVRNTPFSQDEASKPVVYDKASGDIVFPFLVDASRSEFDVLLNLKDHPDYASVQASVFRNDARITLTRHSGTRETYVPQENLKASGESNAIVAGDLQFSQAGNGKDLSFSLTLKSRTKNENRLFRNGFAVGSVGRTY